MNTPKRLFDAGFWLSVAVTITGLGIPALIAWGKFDERVSNNEKRQDVIEKRVDENYNRVDQKLQHISDKLDELRDRLPARGEK
jgi:hypothetical protein